MSDPMSEPLSDRPIGEHPAVSTKATFDEVMAAHTLSVEALDEADIEIAFASCSCGHWNRQCGTVEGLESKRGDHLAHVVEVMRAAGLASRAEDAVEVCHMVHTEPYDFASCETHDTTFALGETCKFDGQVMWHVYADEADDQRGLKMRAEMEAEDARLDNDVLRAAVQQAIKDHPVSSASFTSAISHLLDTDTDVLRDAQKAAWKFGHAAATRGLDETANPF